MQGLGLGCKLCLSLRQSLGQGRDQGLLHKVWGCCLPFGFEQMQRGVQFCFQLSEFCFQSVVLLLKQSRSAPQMVLLLHGEFL